MAYGIKNRFRIRNGYLSPKPHHQHYPILTNFKSPKCDDMTRNTLKSLEHS